MKEIKLIMDVIVIGQMDNTMDNTFESANRVYGVGGVSPTIPTCGGGGIQPKVLEIINLNSDRGGFEVICSIASQASDNFGLNPSDNAVCKTLKAETHDIAIVERKKCKDYVLGRSQCQELS